MRRARAFCLAVLVLAAAGVLLPEAPILTFVHGSVSLLLLLLVIGIAWSTFAASDPRRVRVTLGDATWLYPDVPARFALLLTANPPLLLPGAESTHEPALLVLVMPRAAPPVEVRLVARGVALRTIRAGRGKRAELSGDELRRAGVGWASGGVAVEVLEGPRHA